MTDDTMAGPQPVTSTVIIDAQTRAAAELAWSLDADIAAQPVMTRRPISPWLLGLYGTVMVCSAALGAFVVAVHTTTPGGHSPPQTSSITAAPPVLPSAPPSTTTVTVTPLAPPAPPTRQPAPSTAPQRSEEQPPPPQSNLSPNDATFLDLLNHDGVGRPDTPADRASTLAMGHRVCAMLNGNPPWTLLQITDAIAADNQQNVPGVSSALTWDQCNSFTAAAYTAYCPNANR